MISNKIKVIQKDIDDLEKITDFKKSVCEHARINSEIQSCMERLNELTNTIDQQENNSHNLNNLNNLSELNSDEYNEHIEYLKGMCDVFDQLENVEDQIPIYIDAMNKIQRVTKHLENRKLSITNV